MINEKTRLIETCLNSQDNCKQICDYLLKGYVE